MPLTMKERYARYMATDKGKATRTRCRRAWMAKNREKRNEYMRNWMRANKDRPSLKLSNLRARYKRRYGITIDQYEVMLAEQNGHCALCERKPEQERYKKLHIDHDHETGAIRGLLCNHHNLALGRLGDNATSLLVALAYLTRKPSATSRSTERSTTPDQ